MYMMKKILITGASGLVGKKLISLLISAGYEVNTLTRKKFETDPNVNQYLWDIENKKLDIKALENVDAIVHLAGAGVADERWSSARKKELWESRIKSSQLLYETIKSTNTSIKVLVGASAVGYYGDRGNERLDENATKGKGFLSDLCEAWENENFKFKELGIRVCIGRIGIVLANEGGALKEMMKTVVAGVGGYFSKSPLYYPWIHIDDLTAGLLFLVKHSESNKIFNLTAPMPVLHKELMEEAIKANGQTPILLPTPEIVIKLAIGEMSTMLFNSQNCRSEKLIKDGFKFQYETIEKALNQLAQTKV